MPTRKPSGPSPLARQGTGRYYNSVVSLLRRRPNESSANDIDSGSETLSVPSIAEAKDDARLVEELQAKLDEATSVISSKNDTVKVLEERVDELTASLDRATTEIKDKGNVIQELEVEKNRLDGDLSGTRESLEKVQAEYFADHSRLDTAMQEIENYKAAIALESAARQKAADGIQDLRKDYDELKNVQTKDRAEIQAKSKALQDVTGRFEALSAEFTDLRSKHEAEATRMIELEAEVRGVKRERDTLNLQQSEANARIQSLQDELAASIASAKDVMDEVRAKDDELRAAHEHSHTLMQELEAARAERARQATQLEELTTELAILNNSYAQVKTNAEAAAKEHLHRLDEIERLHQEKHSELSEEARRWMTELKSQESQYGIEIEALRAAHQEEIAMLIAQKEELQRLREKDGSTIEELKAQLDVASNRASDFERQTGERDTALGATQAELAHYREALASAAHESELLRIQLDELRQRLAGVEEAKDEMIECLSIELAQARDTHAALKETFLATDQHAKELEEVARLRETQIADLRAAHQRELATLRTKLSEVNLREDAERKKLQLEVVDAKSRVRAMEEESATHARAMQEKEEVYSDFVAAAALASLEISALKSMLDESRQLAAASDKANLNEISRLMNELDQSRETHAVLTRSLNTTKEQLSKLRDKGKDEGAGRAKEMNQLRTSHQAAVEELHARHRVTIQQEINKRDAELESVRGELANAKAALQSALQQVQALKEEYDKMYQKAAESDLNKDGIIGQLRASHQEQIAKLMAEKVELLRLHNTRIRDLQAQHDSVIVGYRQQLRATGFLGGMAGVVLAGVVHLL